MTIISIKERKRHSKSEKVLLRAIDEIAKIISFKDCSAKRKIKRINAVLEKDYE